MELLVKAPGRAAGFSWRCYGAMGKKMVRVMKLIAFFLLLFCVHVHATGKAQHVTLDVKNATLEKVFQQIKRQTGYTFFAKAELLDKGKRVTVQLTNAPLKEALDRCFENQPFTYSIVGKIITIEPVKLVGPGQPAAEKPAFPVTGKVTGADGMPLADASIKIRGSSSGTTSDANGRFTIQANEGDVLVISYVGYREATIKVTTADANKPGGITVRLYPAVNDLDETVVKGYYRTTKRASTGSVSTISEENIGSQPVIDPVAAMQGRASGLMIVASNGMPASGFQVRIRGENSMSNGNEPLYVVDGVPFIFPVGINQFSGANGNQSPLSTINPGDIERIDILKDADATAIYGSRGANGVILITTKKGKTSDKGHLNLNFFTGISKAGNKLDMLNTQQYLALRNEAFENDGATKTTSNAPDLLVWDPNAYTDWQDLLIGNTAPVTQAQLSFSGGNAQTKFLLSGAVRKEGTVLLGDFSYTRGTAHFTVDHASKDNRLGISASVNFSSDHNDIVPTDISMYFTTPPNFPAYNPDGSLYWYGTTQNPVAYLNRTYETKMTSLIGNSTIRYRLLDGLTAKVNLGYTFTTMNQLQTLPASGFTTISPVPGSTAQYGHSDVNSYIVEPQLDYTRIVGPGKLSVLAGASWQQTVQEGYYYLGAGYSSDAMLKNMRAASTLTLRNYNHSQYKYQAFFGRINYDLYAKYILNLTFRRDGSSRFGTGNKFGNFGAAGAAWVFSGEDFMRDALPFLNYGKLRVSYGVTGNDQIGDYQYLDSWSSTSFPYAGNSGLAPERAFNADFSWETNRKLDIALELGLLRDRISIAAAYYNNRSGNQLVGRTLSPQSGFTSYTANFPALVENKGWEIDLVTRNIQGKDFSWTTNVNITIPSNKLLRYDDLESSGDAIAYEIGQSTRIIKGYRFTGINPDTGVPEFLDVNDDGMLDRADDWVILGETLPALYGGLSNEFTYKNFSLDIFFQFVQQEAPTTDWGPLASAYGARSNKTLVVLDRWQKPGDVTHVPRATVTSSNPANTAFRNYYRTSDAVWGDASYIRLKNVSLKYNLSSLTRRWGIAAGSIYVQGQNLFTITHYNGLDPEINGFDRRFVFPINPFGSVKSPAMPVLRTITVGVNLTI